MYFDLEDEKDEDRQLPDEEHNVSIKHIGTSSVNIAHSSAHEDVAGTSVYVHVTSMPRMVLAWAASGHKEFNSLHASFPSHLLSVRLFIYFKKKVPYAEISLLVVHGLVLLLGVVLMSKFILTITVDCRPQAQLAHCQPAITRLC